MAPFIKFGVWAVPLALLTLLVAVAVAFGGPAKMPPLDSVNQPFVGLRMDSLPALSRYASRDGQRLAYRHYPAQLAAATAGRVVLIHGSSASSQSMHPLASALAANGFTVDALDLRGHGESGSRGDLAYIGQLEDDLQDFMAAVPFAGRNTLAGFSAGGGFALRFAAGPRQTLFTRTVLLSPYLRYDAPTARPGNGGWVSVGVPRVVGLSLLNLMGITYWNHLRVTEFALNDEARKFLTPSYSYALGTNFAPHRDYPADIGQARGEMAIVAGQEDELFYADRFAATFAQAGKTVPVTLVPGLGHITLTLKPAGIAAIVAACKH